MSQDALQQRRIAGIGEAEMMISGGGKFGRHLAIKAYLESLVSRVEEPVDLEPSRIISVSRTLTIEEAFNQLCTSLNLSPLTSRLWIKMDENVDEELLGRKMTSDLTDIIGKWKYIRDMAKLKLSELPVDCVEVMVECKLAVWPKDEALSEWKYHLRVGDMVDCKDQCENWYESVITSVDQQRNSVQVHFKGWSMKFDLTISNRRISTDIAPLYTKTINHSYKCNILACNQQ